MTRHLKAFHASFMSYFSAQFPLIAHSRRNVSVQSVWKIWVLRLTPHSESHAANPSNPAQHLCIRKGQIHVKIKSFIWQPQQLWDVDKIPLSSCLFIVLIHGSFSLSLYCPFSSCMLPSITSPFFTFPYSPSLLRLCLPCRAFWSADFGWPVEHPVSLCLFFLCFSYFFSI